MILNVLIFSVGGIGYTFTVTNQDSDFKEIDLTSCFLSALQSFGRELKEEVQSINFVHSRIVFLPSNGLYTVAVHMTLDESETDGFEFLEAIRDEINVTYADQIQKEFFFEDGTTIKQIMFPIFKKLLQLRGDNNA